MKELGELIFSLSMTCLSETTVVFNHLTVSLRTKTNIIPSIHPIFFFMCVHLHVYIHIYTIYVCVLIYMCAHILESTCVHVKGVNVVSSSISFSFIM